MSAGTTMLLMKLVKSNGPVPPRKQRAAQAKLTRTMSSPAYREKLMAFADLAVPACYKLTKARSLMDAMAQIAKDKDKRGTMEHLLDMDWHAIETLLSSPKVFAEETKTMLYKQSKKWVK